jgi:hexosaminidase
MSNNRHIGIIPFPDKLQFTGGYFSLSPQTPIIADNTIQGITTIMSSLTERIESSTGFLLPVKDKLLQKTKAGIFFVLDDKPEHKQTEEYEIAIEKHSVTIHSKTITGLYYGTITFFQIVYSVFDNKNSESTTRLRIPCMKIADVSRFSWRGLLLDCSRHFMSMEFIKMIIDVLALYKLNRFHWHLTDDQGWRLEIKKYPRLTEVGANRGHEEKHRREFYSQDEVREIVAYAKSRHVEIIPEIEMPGHATAALAAYPEYSCTGRPFEVETKWGIFDDVFCAGNDKTYDFLFSVLDEVCELFPGDFVHIGGDEVPPIRWSNCPKCRKLMEEKKMAKESELESHFLKRISEYLSKKGKKAICWDEATEGDVSSSLVVQYWRSFVSEEILYRALKNGHDVIASPVSHCYLDYPTWQIDSQKLHSFDPCPHDFSPEEQNRLMGIECNMWTEHAPEKWVFEKILPRLMALAEIAWTGPKKQSFKSFRERLSHHENLLNGMGITIGKALSPDYSKKPKLKKPAQIITTMGVHEHFIPECAFAKEKNKGIYRTGRSAKKGESFTLIFKRPQHCSYIKVATRCADVTDNALENGILEISLDGQSFAKLADFRDGFAEAVFDTQKIKALRIMATEDQDSWVAVADIIVTEL